jgi:DNA-binding transcriptional regulator/RsmH inhibitor MraZ
MTRVIELAMTRVIETDEAGRLTLPPELLGEAKPHSRYTVETAGTKLILESEEALLQRQGAYEEWEKEWRAVQEQVGKSWPAGVSAADVVSEMRR